jgi:predicted amidohydrolase YtcJ
VDRNNPYRVLIDEGVHLAFGSDCMPLDPGYGIQLAVNSPYWRQRISVEEAIECYTHGGAYVLGMESTLGEIGPGKIADFAMFPEGYLKEREKLKDRKVELTFVNGRVVYSRLDNR